MPSRFRAKVTSEDDLAVTILGRWDGSNRIELQQVAEIMHADGSPITPRDLTRVQLAEIVQLAGGALAQPGHGAHVGRRPGRKPTPHELKLLASVYWFHYVIWGSPRQAVMKLWDIPRSTANRWIRQAAELYPMPDRDGGED